MRALLRMFGCSLVLATLGGGCGGIADARDPQDAPDAGTGGAAGSQAGGSAGLGGTLSGAGGGAAACPRDASACPPGCHPLIASPYDSVRKCLSTKSLVVGCTAISGGGTADAPCVKRLRDGALFVASPGSIFQRSPPWTLCTPEEGALLSGLCPAEPCAQGSVATMEGCMTCIDVLRRVSEEKDNARTKLAACSSPAGCACVPDDTPCAGACPVAIASDSIAAYADLIAEIGKAYCSDPSFRSVCGYSTPRCAVCSATCAAGMCTSL